MTVATGRLRHGSSIDVSVIEDFDDPRVANETWQAVAGRGIDVVFATRTWQETWWRCFGKGTLVIVCAERDGEPIAIAPLFAEHGMLYFVGSSGSDYLDFLGDVRGDGVLEAVLERAIERTPEFVGARFYQVLDDSPTPQRLQIAAVNLGMNCFDESEMAAPWLDLRSNPALAAATARKKSLVRHENYFRREGRLEVTHATRAADIEPYLDEFFEQHIARWSATTHPSLFLDEAQRHFYASLTRAASDLGWLRFTRVLWDGSPVAMHYGFSYSGTFMWYKPTFAIALAKRSPGEVLLRHLLLAAIEEGAATFDFGIGDEPFKDRFATNRRRVRTWGLYPSSR